MSDIVVDKKEALRNAELAVSAITTAKQTIHTIRGALRRDMPEIMTELEDAETALPKLQEAAKLPLRLLGPGRHDILGHSITVGAQPQRVEPDLEGLIDRAIQRGDLQDLLDAGVLTYALVPDQIGRLDSLRQSIYQSYLKKVPGTSSVTLASELR